MFIFRCPQADYEAIGQICRGNGTDYSRVVNAALFMLVDRLAESGLVDSLDPPPSRLLRREPRPAFAPPPLSFPTSSDDNLLPDHG